MNAHDIAFFPIRGRVDRRGLLIEADPPLAALHARGGGRPGGPVSIPQLAQLAKLVARLQVSISRPVVAADDGANISLFVNASPDGADVTIEIVDARSRNGLASATALAATRLPSQAITT